MKIRVFLLHIISSYIIDIFRKMDQIDHLSIKIGLEKLSKCYKK